jgi:hyperosmotically inducible periplasmic protein
MRRVRPVATALLAFSLLAGAGCTTSDTGAQRTAGQVIDDATLTARVKTAIARDAGLRALAINVDTDRGVVHLKGTVSSSDQATRVIDAAQRVEGVRRVVNELEVRSA